jgi:hypothetical protein
MAQQPNYTPEQVQAALDQGLISPEDAEYLNKALEDSMPWGGMAGGLAGAAAGAAMGAGGSKLAADALGNSAAAAKAAPGAAPEAGAKRQGTADWMNTKTPEMGIPGTDSMLQPSYGELALGGAGAVGGGIGGAMAGDAMLPNEGMGVEGKGYTDPRTGGTTMDPDMALRLLTDPNTPPGLKKQIIEALQRSQDYQDMQGGGEMGGGEMGGEEGGGMDLGGMLGMAGGALGGAALGGAAGHFGAKGLADMAPGGAGMMGSMKNGLQSGGAAMAGEMPMGGLGMGMNIGGATGGGLGMLGGGIGGAMAGQGMMDPKKKYSDPLAGA